VKEHEEEVPKEEEETPASSTKAEELEEKVEVEDAQAKPSSAKRPRPCDEEEVQGKPDVESNDVSAPVEGNPENVSTEVRPEDREDEEDQKVKRRRTE
jgi:hypothetical protein